MKIRNILIHNFRSIKHREFDLLDFSMLVGANDSGKSNIVDALRIFYEKDLKYEEIRDFPKFATNDHESWIDVKYELTKNEYDNLKEDYRISEGRGYSLKVRKYFEHPSKVKSRSSNIYAYEKGGLSENTFYGAQNISQAKLGDVLYIPATGKIEDCMKLSGPSYLRDILNYVIQKIVKDSPSYNDLTKAFGQFTDRFKRETTADGLSIEGFREDINEEIKDRKVKMGFDIRPFDVSDITKNLIEPFMTDPVLGENKLPIDSFGEGLQRRLIYTLIKLSTKYKEKKEHKDKKEFLSNLLLILFEEPEAFLHASQQELLSQSLRKLSKEENQQVLISTHSVHFVNNNIDYLPSILKLQKENGETQIYQITESELKEIFILNKELKEILGQAIEERDYDLEGLRYSLYLNPDRCCAFFADFILICEGATEKALIDYMIKNEELILGNKEVYILNSLGKENIHRYMNLFGELGIRHSVLFDGDKNKGNAERHKKINSYLKNNKNKYTAEIDFFDDELETFLGIQPETDKYKKPLSVLWNYQNEKIEKDKIDALKKKVTALMQ